MGKILNAKGLIIGDRNPENSIRNRQLTPPD